MQFNDLLSFVSVQGRKILSQHLSDSVKYDMQYVLSYKEKLYVLVQSSFLKLIFKRNKFKLDHWYLLD